MLKMHSLWRPGVVVLTCLCLTPLAWGQGRGGFGGGRAGGILQGGAGNGNGVGSRFGRTPAAGGAANNPGGNTPPAGNNPPAGNTGIGSRLGGNSPPPGVVQRPNLGSRLGGGNNNPPGGNTAGGLGSRIGNRPPIGSNLPGNNPAGGTTPGGLGSRIGNRPPIGSNLPGNNPAGGTTPGGLGSRIGNRPPIGSNLPGNNPAGGTTPGGLGSRIGNRPPIGSNLPGNKPAGGTTPGGLGSRIGNRPPIGSNLPGNNPAGGTTPGGLGSRIGNRPPIGSNLPGNNPAGGTTPGGLGSRIGNRPPIGSNLPGNNAAGGTTPGGLGSRLGNRPPIGSNLPGNKVGVGTAIGIGAAINNRNNPGLLPGIGNRPGGIGNGPIANRPGLGNQPVLGRVPTRVDRRDNLRDALVGRGDVRQDNRQDNRQDFRQENRGDRHEDWHDWHAQNDPYHDNWHHGYWNDNHDDYVNPLWNQYPIAADLGVTPWGANNLAYAFGYANYANPYYSEPIPIGGDTYINYGQPLVTTVAVPVETDPAAPPPEYDMQDFDEARQSFFEGNYGDALNSTNAALAKHPQDSVLHEFRSLVLFAQGKYRDSAAGLYAVLAAGPGWDWTTLSSLYPNVATYTEQLRLLEAFQKANPNATEASFLLGYHYLTAGHTEAAARQFAKVTAINPQDRVAGMLLDSLGGVPGQATAAAPPVVDNVPAVPPESITGTWTSTAPNGSRFRVTFEEDGVFKWVYTQDGRTETLEGVYGLEGTTLAMEPDAGGVMLASLTTPNNGQFHFDLIGAPAGDPGLTFQRP